MSRALLVLSSAEIRAKALRWVQKAPDNTRVTFQAPKRSLPQNDRMWAMLTEVAEQVPYHGVKLTPDDLKLVFLDGLKREVRLVPNLDRTGFVNLGRSSSDLSVSEMADMITLIQQFGDANGVIFHDPRDG